LVTEVPPCVVLASERAVRASNDCHRSRATPYDMPPRFELAHLDARRVAAVAPARRLTSSSPTPHVEPMFDR